MTQEFGKKFWEESTEICMWTWRCGGGVEGALYGWGNLYILNRVRESRAQGVKRSVGDEFFDKKPLRSFTALHAQN